MADLIILVLIIGYCIFLIARGYRNKKMGKPAGCAGCGGSCGSCGGCASCGSYEMHPASGPDEK